MHQKMTLLIFSFALLFWTTSGCGQITTFPIATFTNMAFMNHNGAIVLPNGQAIGSGFVFGKQKDVVTCWHVLEDARIKGHETNLFFQCPDGIFTLRVKRELPRYDLALFSTTTQIKGDPSPAGDFGKIRPGDFVIYIGYDSRYSATNNQCVLHAAKVESKGPLEFLNVKTEALFFAGDGFSGYSGGVVYSTNNEIVAIVAAMGGKATIFDGREGRTNVAYTIAPLLDVETNNPPSTLKPSATPKK